MDDILNFIIGIGATVICGIVCTFFVYLNINKDEIWGEIYEKYNFRYD